MAVTRRRAGRLRARPHGRQPAALSRRRRRSTRYGVFLREFLHGGGLWIARAVLLACAVLHVWAAASLTLADRAARPGRATASGRRASRPGRRARCAGAASSSSLFIVYHLLDLTFGAVNPGVRGGPASTTTSWRASGGAGGAVLHRRHGAPVVAPAARRVEHAADARPEPPALRARSPHRVAAVFATIVVAGNISFPLAVLLGVVK